MKAAAEREKETEERDAAAAHKEKVAERIERKAQERKGPSATMTSGKSTPRSTSSKQRMTWRES